MDKISEALDRNFTSPTCNDANFEPANVVDGLYAIANALFKIADIMGAK